TENGLVIESVEKDSTKQSVVSLELDSVPSAYHDHSNINDLDDACMEKEATESGEKKESSGQPVVSFELYSIPSVSYDYLHYLNSLPTSSLASCDDLNAILEASMADLSQLSSHGNLPGSNMLPQLAPIHIEESPPLPSLPPMQ
nr:protein SCAR2-like [Tanacetum cinerariifolium]